MRKVRLACSGSKAARFGEGAREADQSAAERNGKRFGAGGEDHAAPASDQERIVEQLAKATEGVAHRRLRHPCTLGGFGDIAFAGQGVEGDQEIEIDAVEVVGGMSLAHDCIETSHWIHVNAGRRVRAAKRRQSWKKHKKY